MKKPKIEDFYDPMDPRGMSTSEHDEYLASLIRWEKYHQTIGTDKSAVGSTFVDMSESAKLERKKKLAEKRALAEKAWDDSNNEGDANEKSYWIHGFVSALNYTE